MILFKNPIISTMTTNDYNIVLKLTCIHIFILLPLVNIYTEFLFSETEQLHVSNCKARCYGYLVVC